MTPAPNVKIKLSELNTILDEMEQGEAAVKKLAEMDKSLGLQDPQDVVKRMRGQDTVVSTGDTLGDAVLAKQRMEQATRMEREAKGLMAEAQRLMEEAKSLDPSLTAQQPENAVEAKPAQPKVRKVRTKTA
jgi:hypothetical protein